MACCSASPPASVDGLLGRSRGIPAPPRNVAVGVPADLLRRRPDVRAAELRAEAQSAKVGMAAADLWPAFSLGGALGTLVSTTNGNTLKELYTWPSITYAFGPSFSWPVLNYGQITNQVRAQDAELQALLIDYKNVVLKAQKEVENGLAGFVQGRRQVVYLKQSADAASNALTVAIAQYEIGSRDFTTVLTAEQNLYQAQNNLAAAQGGVSVSLTTAWRALGGGWQIRDGHDFVDDAAREEMRARTNYGDVLPPAGQPQPPAPASPARPTPGRPCGLRNGDRREDLRERTPTCYGAPRRRRTPRRAGERRMGRNGERRERARAPVERRLGARQESGADPAGEGAGGARAGEQRAGARRRRALRLRALRAAPPPGKPSRRRPSRRSRLRPPSPARRSPSCCRRCRR